MYPHKATATELFCISVAEAQYAKVYPFSSNEGALETTNMGTVLFGDAEDVGWRRKFVELIAETMNDRDELKKLQFDVHQDAYNRFNPQEIIRQWDEKVFV